MKKFVRTLMSTWVSFNQKKQYTNSPKNDLPVRPATNKKQNNINNILIRNQALY